MKHKLAGTAVGVSAYLWLPPISYILFEAAWEAQGWGLSIALWVCFRIVNFRNIFFPGATWEWLSTGF